MEEKLFVSKHARKTLHTFIEKEYGAQSDDLWKKTIKQYKDFVKKAPDYGGRKSPHFTQINDAVFLLAFCNIVPKEHSLEELEPVSFEIFMSSFNTLGKLFSVKRKWTMDLMSVIFKLSLDKDNKHALNYPADFAGNCEPYDKSNGIVRYCFTRCPLADFVKANKLGRWMPLMCNCDHTELEKIHAKLIREGTCYSEDCCDYCIVSEDNPLVRQYELVRNEDGLLVSRKK